MQFAPAFTAPSCSLTAANGWIRDWIPAEETWERQAFRGDELHGSGWFAESWKGSVLRQKNATSDSLAGSEAGKCASRRHRFRERGVGGDLEESSGGFHASLAALRPVLQRRHAPRGKTAKSPKVDILKVDRNQLFILDF